MADVVGSQISVCLITYNHAAVIESTLASVLDQTLSDYEVIVSDDCSTDGTWEVICEAARRDSRVRAIRTPRNSGMSANANFAVAQATRPLIALLHHDDLYRRDLLEKWAGLINRHGDIGFVFNPYAAHNSSHVWAEAIPAGRVDGRWLMERYLLRRWGCAVRGTAMVRRSAWEAVGGLRERFSLLADIDLWMRLASRGAVGYVDEPLITVRHDRPDDYPDIYKGTSWSWRRQRILFDIHATNIGDYYQDAPIKRAWKLFVFRLCASIETAKWLAYGIIRRKRSMIETSVESETPYDQLWLRWFRRACQIAIRV